MSRIADTDFTTLLNQASATAALYMRQGAEDIDKQFGEGFAKRHPELLIAYMRTAAMDFNTAALCKIFDGGFQELTGGLVEIAQALQDD